MDKNNWIQNAFNTAKESVENLGPDLFGMDDEKMFYRSVEESARAFSVWCSLDKRHLKFFTLSMRDDDFISLLSSMWACGYAAGRSDALGEGDE